MCMHAHPHSLPRMPPPDPALAEDSWNTHLKASTGLNASGIVAGNYASLHPYSLFVFVLCFCFFFK